MKKRYTAAMLVAAVLMMNPKLPIRASHARAEDEEGQANRSEQPGAQEETVSSEPVHVEPEPQPEPEQSEPEQSTPTAKPTPVPTTVPEVEVDIEVRKVWDDYGVPLGILPQTGDESDLLLYASVGLLMLFCAAAMGAALPAYTRAVCTSSIRISRRITARPTGST